LENEVIGGVIAVIICVAVVTIGSRRRKSNLDSESNESM